MPQQPKRGSPGRQLFLSKKIAWQLNLKLKRESVHNGTGFHFPSDYSDAVVVMHAEASGIRALTDNKIVDFVQLGIKEMKICLGLLQRF